MPTDVPSPVARAFDRLKETRDDYIELKEIDGRYYVYKATSEWDSEAQRPKKKTTYLGAISLEGEYTPKQLSEAGQETPRELFEYGTGALAYHFLQDAEALLEELTPHARELLAMAIIRATDPHPLKRHPSRWDHLALSRELDVTVNPKHLSSVLKATGRGVAWWYDFFESLIPDDDLLLYDLTAVFTRSTNITLAEKGYNADWNPTPQLGVVLAFSRESSLPAGVDVYSGSMNDISTLGDFLDRLPTRDIGFILDRAFWSEPLLREFRSEGMSYLAPLKRNLNLFDPRWVQWRGPFSYRKRPIEWGRRRSEHGPIYYFRDPKLEGEQKAALLQQVETGQLNRDTYEEKKADAGIMALVSDLDRPGEEIFDLYKGRQDVEVAFDAMKNTLEADKTYLQSSEAVRGYFFVTMLALRVYFKILKRLRERDVTDRISVSDVTYELSKVQLIVDGSGERSLAKVPKRAREIAALFPEALPMG